MFVKSCTKVSLQSRLSRESYNAKFSMDKCARTNYGVTLKWYYDQNCDSPIQAMLKHKQVVGMRSKMLFTFFKYLLSFQRYSSFKNIQISLVMTSYTQPIYDHAFSTNLYQK